MFSLYLSTYILVLIGLDRLMAVKYPLKMINMGRRIKTSLITIYSLSIVFSIPQVSSKFRIVYNCFLAEEATRALRSPTNSRVDFFDVNALET